MAKGIGLGTVLILVGAGVAGAADRTGDAKLAREWEFTLGLVQKEVRIVMTYGLAALLPGPKDKSSILEASANVASFGSETRLRINFQLKSLENGSNLKQIQTVLDGRAYQEFFSKVDKGLFRQREDLEPSS
jgi:hypothetical protein